MIRLPIPAMVRSKMIASQSFDARNRKTSTALRRLRPVRRSRPTDRPVAATKAELKAESMVPPMKSVSEFHRPRRIFKLCTAWLWCAALGAMAAYAVLKPRTTAGDFSWIPESVTVWLDQHPDLRTLIMTLGVLCIPALMLAARRENRRRRILLAVMVSLMVACEILQVWIPTRRFSIPDLAYTLLGGTLVEAGVVGWQRWLEMRWSAQRLDDR